MDNVAWRSLLGLGPKSFAVDAFRQPSDDALVAFRWACSERGGDDGQLTLTDFIEVIEELPRRDPGSEPWLIEEIFVAFAGGAASAGGDEIVAAFYAALSASPRKSVECFCELFGDDDSIALLDLTELMLATLRFRCAAGSCGDLFVSDALADIAVRDATALCASFDCNEQQLAIADFKEWYYREHEAAMNERREDFPVRPQSRAPSQQTAFDATVQEQRHRRPIESEKYVGRGQERAAAEVLPLTRSRQRSIAQTGSRQRSIYLLPPKPVKISPAFGVTFFEADANAEIADAAAIATPPPPPPSYHKKKKKMKTTKKKKKKKKKKKEQKASAPRAASAGGEWEVKMPVQKPSDWSGRGGESDAAFTLRLEAWQTKKAKLDAAALILKDIVAIAEEEEDEEVEVTEGNPTNSSLGDECVVSAAVQHSQTTTLSPQRAPKRITPLSSFLNRPGFSTTRSSTMTVGFIAPPPMDDATVQARNLRLFRIDAALAENEAALAAFAQDAKESNVKVESNQPQVNPKEMQPVEFAPTPLPQVKATPVVPRTFYSASPPPVMSSRWARFRDAGSGRYFYHDSASGKTTWDAAPTLEASLEAAIASRGGAVGAEKLTPPPPWLSDSSALGQLSATLRDVPHHVNPPLLEETLVGGVRGPPHSASPSQFELYAAAYGDASAALLGGAWRRVSDTRY